MKQFIATLFAAQLAIGLSAGASQLSAAEPPSVAYRLKETKTIHFDDARKAQLHLETVKKLGCEAKMDGHGGHMDVMYRMTTWKALTLADENTAHQWEDWMKKSGFETLHAHGEDHDHSGADHAGHDHGHTAAEILTYSQPEWKTTHTRDAREATELAAILKGMGCDVQTERHGDHDDVVFRCARPMHLEFPSHQVAAGWEDWLNRTGFRTQHVH